MEPRLRLESFSPQAGLEPGTARSVSQRFNPLRCTTRYDAYKRSLHKLVRNKISDKCNTQMLFQLCMPTCSVPFRNIILCVYNYVFGDKKDVVFLPKRQRLFCF